MGERCRRGSSVRTAPAAGAAGGRTGCCGDHACRRQVASRRSVLLGGCRDRHGRGAVVRPRPGPARSPASQPSGASLDFVDVGSAGSLMASALAVAALAALESLLCATVADGMSVNEHHDPDRELFGQGLANVVVPMFGGVPATAAIARTAVNVRAGARSRLAAVTHSIVLLASVFALAPLVSDIPLAALAGVLFATCIRMVETGSILALMRSTRSDALIVGADLHGHRRARPRDGCRRGGRPGDHPGAAGGGEERASRRWCRWSRATTRSRSMLC